MQFFATTQGNNGSSAMAVRLLFLMKLYLIAAITCASASPLVGSKMEAAAPSMSPSHSSLGGLDASFPAPPPRHTIRPVPAQRSSSLHYARAPIAAPRNAAPRIPARGTSIGHRPTTAPVAPRRALMPPVVPPRRSSSTASGSRASTRTSTPEVPPRRTSKASRAA